MWYNFGRFWRILFIFDPIETVDPGVWYNEFSGDLCWDGDCTSSTLDNADPSSARSTFDNLDPNIVRA